MSARGLFGALASAVLLLGACEDVDRWATPTPVAVEVVVASSERVDLNSQPGAAAQAPEAVPTTVAGVAVRREPAGPAAETAPPAATVVVLAPPGTPTPAALPRRTPALSRRAAATATARAALGRVVRPGTADEARQAGGAARAALAASGVGSPGSGAAGAASAVDGAELVRRLNGLSPTDPRCTQLAVIAQGAGARRETAPFPLTRSPEAELLLERLRIGCGLEGVALTPELAAAIAALPPPAPGAAGVGAAGAGAAGAGAAGADLGTLADRGRLEAERRLLERERARPGGLGPAAAPIGAAPRPPPARETGFTAPATAGRPPAYNGVRAATGIR
ncbi:MAG TPA: hypothetical protein VG370_34580 [Chloroflexota bacterium]|nr:hypothetical protein [Chloroflexota bacterium]